ncbi:preprotein translocase subunit SecA [Tyzzerella sp. An114]|uniref:preprotein translocase subunit SecA n=1 Tax=Tyzzerella sp. An114 TaxID=1965545 RepID=UPI000B43CD11|nr:preprotein translocase subunit SecA [Tyzzerella sp. An114]OUQ59175.1 preprotein translocase subunit SecA [Tyzzerella sp. An114]
MGLLEKIFGNYSDKEIKKIIPVVDKIESLEAEISKLSDDELRGKTEEFKKRVQEQGESLDNILPEAFAVVREASKRVTGMRHFRVQLIGGIVLHQGRISEMKTGEGKTLVATLPAYLNALTGRGVHVVTVNDYLAKRDAESMGEIYNFLGLTCGVILNDMKPDERRAAYNCDITYATNNELGFDYLRDNMVVRRENMVQRDLVYAIIDEVDSVLIDEARTPLIISGSGDKSTQLYKVADAFVKMLKKGRILNEEDALNPLIKEDIQEEGDFVVDEKAKSVVLTQDGVKKAEKFFNVENLSDPENLELQHHINNALKANYNMHLDKDYVVNDDEILIVDEFTGRIMPGRRYSDGLHQAIEAKENVKVKRESKTLATITFQNFFNKYEKKAGMTGTAQTEESEFRNIYGLDVVIIPTNRPVQRIDRQDVVYRTEAAKFRAVVRDVIEAHEKGQPVLVGTVTIDKSEELSKMLKREGIRHQVLNAKYHEKEAEIVALAGQMGAVTIATNMAGRGTDIKLGEGVQELGGLKIIGTERHESRRIDNQLRGRSGRQGDPGESRFFISMEDDLMRLFGSEKTMKIVDAMGLEEDDPIEHGMLTKAIENAQKKVEGNNFAVRKHLLDYDEVMNEQRELIYGERRRVLFGENLRDSIMSMIKEFINRTVEGCVGEVQYAEDWDMKELNEQINAVIPMGFVNIKDEKVKEMTKDKLKEVLEQLAVKLYEFKEKEIGDDEKMRELERVILLRVIDQKWMDHIDDMDQMRQGIGLHAYAQRDPLIEYKYAAYDMFNEMSENIQKDTIKTLYHVRIVTEPVREEVQRPMFTNRDDSAQKKPIERKEEKIGRNDLCPCGSGLKYKQCCGKNA